MAGRKVEIVLEAKEKAKAAIEATTKALREQNEAIKFTQNLYRQTLTEEEKFVEGQKKISAALRSGKVTLDEYTRALNQLGRSYAAAGGGFGAGVFGAMRGILPAVGVGLVARASFNGFMEQDLAESRLQGVLNASGRNDISMAGVQGFASRRQRNTMFGDETTIGAGAVLSTFGNIKGADFERTLMLAQDLSTVMGTDLQDAALKLGKALEDPEQFMNSLARSGIVFSDAIKEQIKAFNKGGDSAKAQALMFSEMQKKIGGAAEVAGASASGAWAQLKNAIGEVGEAIGGLAAGPMRGLADFLKGIVPKNASEFTVPGGVPQTKGELASRKRQLQSDMKTAYGRGFEWSWNPLTLWGNLVDANNSNTQISSAMQQIDALPNADSLPEELRYPGAFGGVFRALNKGSGAGAFMNSLPGLAQYGSAKAMGMGEGYADLFGGWQDRVKGITKAQFDKFSAPFESPSEKRDRLLKELDSYSGVMPAGRIGDIRARIQKDYEDDTKTKTRKGMDEALGATESRFLTRGPGLMQVEQQRETNKKLDQTNKKLDAMIKAFQQHVGDIVVETLA